MSNSPCSIYIFWSYHSPAKGVYDFETGSKNLQRFFDTAKEAGLWVIARAGPYCNVRASDIPRNTPDLLLTPSPRPRQVAVALRSGVQMDHSGRRGPATRHIINHGSPGLPKSARSLRTTRLPTGEYVCSPNSWQTENPKRLTEFAARHPKSDRKRAPGDSPLR